MRIKFLAACLVVLCSLGSSLSAQTSSIDVKNGEPETQKMTRKEATDIVAATRKIVSPNGVEELLAIPINGTQQWISVRGRDRRNPILLMLHGGPGAPSLPVAYTFQNPWEDYFTVVQWDQRGAGKTYAANDPKAVAETMTVDQMTSDAEEVVRHLQKTYGKKKIFLLGHSWGTVLGVAVAQRHPEWLYAYVSVGQLIDTKRNEAEGYEFALSEAKRHNNTEAVKDLEGIAPYPGEPGSLTFARIGVQRKWLTYYGGLTYGRTSFSYDANAWTLSPDYTDKDLDAVDDGSLFSLTHLLGPLEAVNLTNVTTFGCPLFVFEGRHDYATSHTLAEAWFKSVKAPEKKFVWFENSAHMVMQEEPGRFLHHLVVDVRPLAVRVGDAAPDEVSE